MGQTPCFRSLFLAKHMQVVLDGLGSAALLWESGRGGGDSPCCGTTGIGPCTGQELHHNTGTLRIDAWTSTAPVGQAEIIQKLSFLLLCLYAVDPLGLLGFFCLILPSLPKSPCVETSSGLSWAQDFTVTRSTFCVYVFFSGARWSPEAWRCHSSSPPPLPVSE